MLSLCFFMKRTYNNSRQFILDFYEKCRKVDRQNSKGFKMFTYLSVSLYLWKIYQISTNELLNIASVKKLR